MDENGRIGADLMARNGLADVDGGEKRADGGGGEYL